MFCAQLLVYLSLFFSHDLVTVFLIYIPLVSSAYLYRNIDWQSDEYFWSNFLGFKFLPNVLCYAIITMFIKGSNKNLTSLIKTTYVAITSKSSVMTILKTIAADNEKEKRKIIKQTNFVKTISSSLGKKRNPAKRQTTLKTND